MLLHWFVTFWGNLAGSLFVVAIITGYGDVFSTPPFSTESITFANKKMVTPGWDAIFLRGIGANWLVCMACFLAFMAREYFSKVIAIWWPTFAFVALGLDHVVANSKSMGGEFVKGDKADFFFASSVLHTQRDMAERSRDYGGILHLEEHDSGPDR